MLQLTYRPLHQSSYLKANNTKLYKVFKYKVVTYNTCLLNFHSDPTQSYTISSYDQSKVQKYIDKTTLFQTNLNFSTLSNTSSNYLQLNCTSKTLHLSTNLTWPSTWTSKKWLNSKPKSPLKTENIATGQILYKKIKKLHSSRSNIISYCFNCSQETISTL